MSSAISWRCESCARVSAGLKCRRCGVPRACFMRVVVPRGPVGSSVLMPGHATRVAEYARRAALRLPLFDPPIDYGEEVMASCD